MSQMSLFADSSVSPLGKHPGLNGVGFQIDTKIPVDAGGHSLLNCVDAANAGVPHHKSELIEPIGNRILWNPDDTESEEAIAAVPLRCVPLSNEHQDYGKAIGEEENNAAYDCVGNRGIQAERWDADLRKLEELVAKAKECISIISEKTTSGSDLDEGHPAKRIKFENDSYKMVDEVGASGAVNELDDNDIVLILSPEEWNASTPYFTHKTDDGDKSSSSKAGRLDCSLGGMDPDEHNEEVSHPDQIEIKSSYSDYPECTYSCVKNDSMAIADYCDELVHGVAESDYELNNYSKFINLSDSEHDGRARSKVMTALKWLEEKYKALSRESSTQSNEGKGGKQFHLIAAECLKSEGMWIFVDKAFGRIPGIEIGDEFRFRSELSVVGIHRQAVCGIDYVVLDGKKFATSVVNSGMYSNQAKSRDVFIYSGSGGNSKICDKVVDQKLEKGNAALVNSMKMRFPIRVTNKTKISGNDKSHMYVYDGLYTIQKFWQERDKEDGNLVFRFELHRMAGQSRPCEVKKRARRLFRDDAYVIVNDASEGKEKFPVRVINEVDDHRPQAFVYVNKIVYPDWYRPKAPIGCDCINGCSDSQPCACLMKNGGEIPFNEEGNITRVRPIVHECGPSCKCPPSCMNRVSQHGPRYQLDLFKTASRGWGVRSRNAIPSGSFICEYIGELLSDEEAELRVGNDEYLFDIFDKDGGGFAIDAKNIGNIGRFINHSCSPNLYAQEVLYDLDDRRIPHIMFFSTKNIPPLQELSYDYCFKKVCDMNGNAKMKECFCGSSKCTGRMY